MKCPMCDFEFEEETGFCKNCDCELDALIFKSSDKAINYVMNSDFRMNKITENTDGTVTLIRK